MQGSKEEIPTDFVISLLQINYEHHQPTEENHMDTKGRGLDCEYEIQSRLTRSSMVSIDLFRDIHRLLEQREDIRND